MVSFYSYNGRTDGEILFSRAKKEEKLNNG